jgi:LacI family transcriptional regulator
MGKAYVTIKDLARELGLSISTISRALRDLPDVHPDTRQQVQELARARNYQPNRFASGLVRQETRLIGVVAPRFSAHSFANMISGIEELAYEEGYQLVLCESKHDAAREQMGVEALLTIRVDGLIIAPAIEAEGAVLGHLHEVRRRGVPMVYVDRVYEALPAPAVLTDDFQAGYEATSALIARGRRRIAYLGGASYLSFARERRRGYLKALQDQGLAAEAAWAPEAGFSPEEGQAAMARILEGQGPWPDAVFAVSDGCAAGAMRAIRQRGLRIPEDIALIGFGNDPWTAWLEPPLSSVLQPMLETGRLAARLLIGLIQGPAQAADSSWHHLPAGLLIRESLEAPPH